MSIPKNLREAIDSIEAAEEVNDDILDLAPEFGIVDDNDWHLIEQFNSTVSMDPDNPVCEPIPNENDWVIGTKW